MAGQGSTRDEALHGVAQVVDLLRIDGPHLGQRALGLAVASGRDERGHVGHAAYCAVAPEQGSGTPRTRAPASYKA